MKILKKRKGLLNDRSARFFCKGCGSLIEAKQSEGKFKGEQKAEDKAHNEKIIQLISEKNDESLKGKTIKQLEAMLR